MCMETSVLKIICNNKFYLDELAPVIPNQNSYHQLVDNHLKLGIMEMSPKYQAVVQLIYDPCQQQTGTKISQHVQRLNH